MFAYEVVEAMPDSRTTAESARHDGQFVERAQGVLVAHDIGDAHQPRVEKIGIGSLILPHQPSDKGEKDSGVGFH